VRRLTSSGSRRAVSPGADERRRTILLWGAAESGKSGLVGALRSEGTKTVGDRWTVDLGDASPDVVAYADSASLALRLRDVKETTIRRPERAFTIPVRRYAGRALTAAADLTVLDPCGELAAEPTTPAARRAIAAARTADGILWLLETPLPGGRPLDRFAILRQLVAILDAASATEIAVPVAVALTKVDRLPSADMKQLFHAPEQGLRAILGDAAFGWLLAAFPRLRCFALTAAGTVRNVARPVGLTTLVDWFADEWRREEEAADTARTRARRSARVARVRRRAPLAATLTAAAAVIAFAGVAAARLLSQRSPTWTSSAGSVVPQAAAASPVVRADSSQALSAKIDRTKAGSAKTDSVHVPSIAFAAAALERGDAIAAMRDLSALRLSDSSAQRYAADSILAAAALRGAEDILTLPNPSIDVLESIVAATTAAIARAHPGTPVLAPLSLARAAACIGGHLSCPADQVREDLAWALLLGTPAEQDQARRFRAALVGDPVRVP
jgi:hypothetical protein